MSDSSTCPECGKPPNECFCEIHRSIQRDAALSEQFCNLQWEGYECSTQLSKIRGLLARAENGSEFEILKAAFAYQEGRYTWIKNRFEIFLLDHVEMSGARTEKQRAELRDHKANFEGEIARWLEKDEPRLRDKLAELQATHQSAQPAREQTPPRPLELTTPRTTNFTSAFKLAVQQAINANPRGKRNEWLRWVDENLLESLEGRFVTDENPRGLTLLAARSKKFSATIRQEIYEVRKSMGLVSQ